MPPRSKPGRGRRPAKTAMRVTAAVEAETGPANGGAPLAGEKITSTAASAAAAGSLPSSPSPLSTPRKTAKRVAYALLHWDDLPAWRRDNAFILRGYRPTSHSYAASLASIAGLHNESVNIWTHLLGAVIAAVLGLTLYVEAGALLVPHLARVPSFARISASLAAASPASTVVLSCFAAGAVSCLGMSATYHALSNHSPAVARWGNKLDYSGIVFLIVGSYVPTLYYGFACHHPRWLAVYLYLIGLLGLACLAVSWLEHFRTPAWRPYRALLFVGLGASGVVPICHALFLLDADTGSLAERYQRLNDRMGLNWVLLQGFFYIFGAFVYAARWPERWRPGHFDIWGSSHQIFHVFVLLAATAHLRGIMKAYEYHHTVMGGDCSVPPLG